jgi:hypothetical protein
MDLRRYLAAALAVGAVVLLGAAGPKPPPISTAEPAPSGVAPPPSTVQIVGSCTVGKGTCVDYEGTFAGGAGPARCRKAKGTWSDDACPTERRVGTCRQRETGSDDRTLTRSYQPATEKGAKAACRKTPRGVFLPR